MTTETGTGWVTPTLRKNYETGEVAIVDPPQLAGRIAVSVAARPCGRPYRGLPSGQICGLVAGHYGSHWICDAELVAESGPFALIRVTP